jgi:hypothetical protein
LRGVERAGGGAGRTPAEGIADAWARFQSERGASLDAWVEAERSLADTRRRGIEDFAMGDRLLHAEAALQTAIVDFAAAQPGVSNPTQLAIEILRLAEARLTEALKSPRSPSGDDRRRPARRSPAKPK